MMKSILSLLVVFLLFASQGKGFCQEGDSPSATLLILGSSQCLNCRLMTPILDDLRKEYEGVVAMPYIDVKINRDQARIYGVRRLPTLILFDSRQRQVFRHEGFLDRGTLAKKMDLVLAGEGKKL